MCQTVDVSKMLVAVLSGETAVLVVDDAHQDGSLFLDLLTDVVVIAKDDDQRVFLEVLAF